MRLPYREVAAGLYVGAPCDEIGWPSQGDSYFDRLWRRGVSRHSATADRYVMCWERNGVAVGAVPERPVVVVVVEKKRKSSKGLKNLLKKKRKRRKKGNVANVSMWAAALYAEVGTKMGDGVVHGIDATKTPSPRDASGSDTGGFDRPDRGPTWHGRQREYSIDEGRLTTGGQRRAAPATR